MISLIEIPSGEWSKPDKKCSKCNAKFSEDCRIFKENGECITEKTEKVNGHCGKRESCTIFKRYPDRCIDGWDLCFWLK